MPVMPTASVHQLIQLQRVVRRSLGDVRVPLLLAHGALDATANPADLEAIASGVGSACVERLVLERSGHVVPVDFDGPRLCSAVAEFFASTTRD
jgi:esterase/lipase